MYERILGRWAHTRPVVWAIRVVIALIVVAIVTVTWAASVWVVRLYWPLKESLKIDEAFQIGQFVVLTFGLASVVLLWKQSKDSAKWNRLLSYHQFFADWPDAERRKKMFEVMTRYGEVDCLHGRGRQVSPDFVTKLLAAYDDHQIITLYLDDFEQLCGAVNCEVIDEPYVRCLERTRVIRIFQAFRPLIEEKQKHNGNAYLEFERLAVKWTHMRDKEEEAERKAAADQERKNRERRYSNGVQPAAPK